MARLIVRAAERSQVLVVSHAPILVAALAADDACRTVALQKELGETHIVDAGPLDAPLWRWPAR
jgi:predicted ATPase